MILAAFQKAQQLPISEQQLALANLLGVILLVAGVTVYARVFRRVGENGGRVRTDHLQLPDLFIAISLIVGLTLLALLAFISISKGAGEAASAKGEMTVERILSGSMFLFIPAVGICAFFAARRISLREAFGMGRISLAKVPFVSAGLILALFPALLIVNLVTMKFFPAYSEPQELVKVYKTAVDGGRFDIIGAIIFSATIMAPLAEEFLFRGYFYPVLKRLVGPFSSAVFVSVLFGAVHGNLLTLPSLVLLAFALTLAYEWSGSLLLPIFMHAVFNASNLLLMWAASRYGFDV